MPSADPKAIAERVAYRPRWIVTKYASDADYQAGRSYEQNVVDGNRLLNEGITELLNLIIGDTAAAFSPGNARLGVGSGTTAELASQTALQGGSKLYKTMTSPYPTVSGQTCTWRAVFGADDANFAWNEFSVMNGADENTDENLNRKLSSQGTKAQGQTWTLDLQITFS